MCLGNSHGSQLISSLPVMHWPDIFWGEASVGSYHAVIMTSLDTISGTTPMKTLPRYTLTPPDLSPLYHFPISDAYLGLFLRFPFPNSHSVILVSSLVLLAILLSSSLSLFHPSSPPLLLSYLPVYFPCLSLIFLVYSLE